MTGKKEPANPLEANSATADTAKSGRLLELLDGLPLAIAQAGAYLQESRVGVDAYLRFYEQQWSELMESESVTDAPLQDYPDRSVWTTWAISYQAIREKHENIANLLLLWSFLDNKDLWHGLFATACGKSAVAIRMLSQWIGDIASSDLAFSGAMRLLRNYSLIEKVEGAEKVEKVGNYAMHPVVHQWAYHYRGKQCASDLGQLAVVVVGWAIPLNSTQDYSVLQRRLLPHAQVCSRRVIERHARRECSGSGANMSDSKDADKSKEQETTLDAIHLLGRLYTDQGKPAEAEQMYTQALQGKEQALGPNHTSTLDTVNNLGILYKNQGKLAEAEQMYMRALRGYEEALGPSHKLTLGTINNLGALYADQGKLAEAEQMFARALQGKEQALGPNHTSTLDTVNNLGNLYKNQGKLAEAKQMYVRALRGYEDALGHDLVQKCRPALSTLENMGILSTEQGQYARAQTSYLRALSGLQLVLSLSQNKC